MRRAYPYLFTILATVGCDDELTDGTTISDAATSMDASRSDAAIDARTPSDAATPHDAALVSDAAFEPDAAPTDASLDAGPASSNTNGIVQSGKTCLGSADTILQCEPEQCLPALFTLVNDGSSPYSLYCSGCNFGLAPSDPSYVMNVSELGFDYRLGSDASTVAFMAFDPALRDAHTTTEAQAAVRFGGVVSPQALGTQPGITDATANLAAEHLSSVEVVSYDGRQLHVIVRGVVNALRGSAWYPTLPYPCVQSDNPIPGTCVTGRCTWADAQHGGSGEPARFAYDLTMELPW